MSNDPVSLQNRLQREISRYVNGCGSSRGVLIQSLVYPRLPYHLRAASVVGSYLQFAESLSSATARELECEVPLYDGSNACVQSMMEQLGPLQPCLRGAYVHGSLATSDAIPYSDFDALVILKDDVCRDARRLMEVACTLNGLRRTMFEFDPLQHHGWFVLTEADLLFYCDAYFPFELFRYSRSLVPGSSSRIQVAPRDSRREFRMVFERALDGVERKLNRGGGP